MTQILVFVQMRKYFVVKSQTFLIQRAINKYIIMLIFCVGVHRYTAECPCNKQYVFIFCLFTTWRRMSQTAIKNSVALVRTRTIPTEWPPPVGEVSANFCGQRGVTWSAQRIPTAVNLCFLDLEPLLFSFKQLLN